MKRLIYSLIAVMLMTLAANAGTKTVVWDEATINNINVGRSYMNSSSQLNEFLSINGITMSMYPASGANMSFYNNHLEANCKLYFQNTEGLNLEAAGITLDAKGNIPTNDNFQHSTLNSQPSTLYAIGDVNGRQMLAHAAEMQAIRAVNHILGKADGIRFDIMPAAIFTEPEAACVGPSEDQLKADGIDYICKKSFWRANGKAQAMNETEGILKLFADRQERILGCHAYGAHAADIIQEVSVLMCKNTTLSELRDMIHIHPTLSEILKTAVDL